VHHNLKVGVLLEVNCETDFMARSENFQSKCRDIAMHIAALNPRWLKREDVPEEISKKELEMIRAESQQQLAGKPEQVIEKILDGKLAKFYSENCLLDQKFC